MGAIGLTGNVLQFVQYAIQIISSTNQIYQSAKGSSQRNDELEKIYGRLEDFTTSLQAPNPTQNTPLQPSRGLVPPSQSSESIVHINALNELAKDCRGVCDQLLTKVRKIKIEDGRWRRCRSLRAALESAWDSKSIADLEARLEKFQTVILLHFFPILRYVLAVDIAGSLG